MIKLRICVFDRNCEEYPTDNLLYIHENNIGNRSSLLRSLQHALTTTLKKMMDEQGFDYSSMAGFSIQTDAREGLIRLRDEGDVIGEPGNIAMMFNLRLVE